jgi:hypothetical protein
MSAATQATPAEATAGKVVQPKEVVIYSHSGIFYWWPVWSVGYLFALLTYLQGQRVHFGDADVLVHPSKNLGVIYTFVFLLVILLTHISVRGMASLTVILAAVAVTLFFAYMDWWEDILRALGKLAIYMNLGFYLFFPT